MIGTIPDWLLALFAPLWWKVHPNRRAKIVIPQKVGWLVRRGGLLFYVPTLHACPDACPDFNLYSNEVLNKYILKSFVEIENSDTVVDVGSFIGGFSFSASKVARRVFAVEPDPRNFYCLKRNVGFLENVTVIKKLLWKESCKLQLKIGYNPSDSSVINIDDGPARRSIIMEASTISDLANEQDIDQIDFLKIDAEGAEPEVLEGADDILEDIQKISVDASSERKGKSTVFEVRKFLDSHGFEVRVIDNMVYARK